MAEMKLQDLKNKTPTDLLAFAESLEVENASTMSSGAMPSARRPALSAAVSMSRKACTASMLTSRK